MTTNVKRLMLYNDNAILIDYIGNIDSDHWGLSIGSIHAKKKKENCHFVVFLPTLDCH